MQGSSKNLDQLMQLAETDEQRSAVYLLSALVLPKGDFNAQKIFLEMAVRTNPNSPHARYYSEYFSLALAESLLGFYESTLQKAGIFRPLGMMHFEKDGVNLTTIAHEIMENTLHSMVYAFTNYPDYLQGQWSLQLNRLWENRALLAEMREAMTQSGQPITLSELFKKPRTYHVQTNRTSLREFKETPFIQDLLENGYMTKLPSLGDLGVPVAVDFINISLTTIAVDLINIWNATWLIGLPIGVHKLVHLAEGSKYFSGVAHSFEHLAHHSGIASTAEKLRSIPFGLGVIPAFIVVESADGCLIGIAKMAHDALQEAQLRDSFQFSPDPHLFRTR